MGIVAYLLSLLVLDLQMFMDLVFEYGPNGILILWLWFVMNDVKALKKDLAKAHEDHKLDLKNAKDEISAIVDTLIQKINERNSD